MDWANVTKIHTPPSAKRYSPPPGQHALYKGNFATGNGELSKVFADIAVSGPYVGKPTNIALETAAGPTRPLLSCCLLTKARSSIPLGAIAVVSDTLFSELYVMRVFSFYFPQLIAKERPDEHCISAFH